MENTSVLEFIYDGKTIFTTSASNEFEHIRLNIRRVQRMFNVTEDALVRCSLYAGTKGVWGHWQPRLLDRFILKGTTLSPES